MSGGVETLGMRKRSVVVLVVVAAAIVHEAQRRTRGRTIMLRVDRRDARGREEPVTAPDRSRSSPRTQDPTDTPVSARAALPGSRGYSAVRPARCRTNAHRGLTAVRRSLDKNGHLPQRASPVSSGVHHSQGRAGARIPIEMGHHDSSALYAKTGLGGPAGQAARPIMTSCGQENLRPINGIPRAAIDTRGAHYGSSHSYS